MATRQSGRRVSPSEGVDNHVPQSTGSFRGVQDIVVVQKKDGKILSTPWRIHEIWGYWLSWKKEILVKVHINGEFFDDIEMRSEKRKDGIRTFSYTPTTVSVGKLISVLKGGRNDIRFFSNKSEVHARIYLLSPESRLIVTDIDKTLTKSVILGFSSLFKSHPRLHEGSAAMFSTLEKNGFTIVYLTARPITWSRETRNLISDHALNEDNAKLPDGPLFCSNAGLFQTIFQGHFLRHDKVKIPILKELQAIFGEGLYAGFGDADSDRRSYAEVGIPYKRIFKIRKNGDLRRFNKKGEPRRGCASQSVLADFLGNFGKPDCSTDIVADSNRDDQPLLEERPSSSRSKKTKWCRVVKEFLFVTVFPKKSR